MRSSLFSFFAGVATLTLVLVGPSGLPTVASAKAGVVDAQQGTPAKTAAPRAAAPKAAVPPGLKPAPPGPLPPIPYEGYPSARPMAVVQATYEFAARHPEVLSYQPCFCGCDNSAGHKSNSDCFVKRRAADGRILEWDSHGYGCAVCIDVARDSMQMYNSGASVSSIRGAIDAKYATRFPATMKTPKPPAAVKK